MVTKLIRIAIFFGSVFSIWRFSKYRHLCIKKNYGYCPDVGYCHSNCSPDMQENINVCKEYFSKNKEDDLKQFNSIKSHMIEVVDRWAMDDILNFSAWKKLRWGYLSIDFAKYHKLEIIHLLYIEITQVMKIDPLALDLLIGLLDRCEFEDRNPTNLEISQLPDVLSFMLRFVSHSDVIVGDVNGNFVPLPHTRDLLDFIQYVQLNCINTPMKRTI